MVAGSRSDERAWIRGAQSGSVPDLEALFKHHWPRAYRAAYLVVHDSGAAEDIAQEAFLAAVRSLDRFDRRRPFGPWLHRIVVNRAIDWSRSRALRRESGDAALALVAAAAPAERDDTEPWQPRSRTFHRSIAPSSSCGTYSTTRPGRSQRRSDCHAAPSTRGYDAGSTSSPESSTRI